MCRDRERADRADISCQVQLPEHVDEEFQILVDADPRCHAPWGGGSNGSEFCSLREHYMHVVLEHLLYVISCNALYIYIERDG